MPFAITLKNICRAKSQADNLSADEKSEGSVR
jgi:hypothetical protein